MSGRSLTYLLKGTRSLTRRTYSTMTLRFFAVILVASAVTSFAEDAGKEHVLLRDGFEKFQKQQLEKGPPDGWIMWGLKTDKVPSNFVVDTSDAHSGRASFRIRHPANTMGYVALNPRLAIRPKRNRAYTLSFWAKADKETEGSHGISVYSTIHPNWQRAHSPADLPIHLGPQWRRFSFTYVEGIHFFVEGQSPHLLLMFLPTTEKRKAEEKTLWIDDVLVTEKQIAAVKRLDDSSTLPSARLHHALKPGKEVRFEVDVSRRVRPCYRQVAGVSFWRLVHPGHGPFNAEGKYVLDPHIEKSIRELHLPMARLYGVGDEAPASGQVPAQRWSIEESIDRVAALCDRIDTPQEWFFLELENQFANRPLSPEVWARAVTHAKGKGYSFRYWEVGNETYAAPRKGKWAFAKPEDYLRHFQAVSRAIHRADPQAKVGLSVSENNPMRSSYLLREAAGSYDFVVPHFYTHPKVAMPKAEFTPMVLTENAKVLNSILDLNTRIQFYNPKRTIPILDTEWGLHGRGPKGESPGYVARDGNIWAVTHDAVRLIYYAREGLVRGASAWSMISPNQRIPGLKFLFADAPQQRTIRYWLFYYVHRHLGDWVVQLDGTSPFYRPEEIPEAYAMPATPTVATVTEDGKRLFVIVANGQWNREFTCRARLKGFSPQRVSAILLSDFRQDASNAHPLIERKEDAIRELATQVERETVTFKLPGHSIAFVQVTRD